jgi:single-strand DNA-binding protein
MSSLNKVQLMGRLGADPEVRRVQSTGKPIVNMRLATSEVWRDKQTGERKERTEWHTVVIFNERICGVAEQYLKKGHLVYIEGMLATRKWQDQSGQDRWSTEVVIKEFQGELKLMPQGNGRQGASSPDDYGSETGRSERSSGASTGGSPDFGNELDDEIPF